MHQTILKWFCWMLIAASSVAASPFETANQQFRSADFSAAAGSYEKILTETGPNAATYYNLGNSYQALKQYGPAILAYERARLLTPRDPELRANLALACKDAGISDPSAWPPWIENLLNLTSRLECSWILLGASCSVGLLLLLNGLVRLPRRFLAVGVMLSSLLVLGTTAELVLRRNEAKTGILTNPETRLLLSPFANSDSLASPKAGHRVLIGQRQGDFRFVELPALNLRGWVASHDVAPLIPEEPRP